MGGEDIHICQICQSEFETEEDLSLHACVEIKEELQDPKILVGYDICHDYGLDLSEEFLSGILKLVNELCDVVRNGDPDLKRTSEVNKNLNNAVSCYRNKLDLIDSKFDKNQIVTETNSKEHFLEGFLPHSENESAKFDYNEYNPKVTEGKKKKELSNKNNKRKLKEAKISDIKIKPKLKGELLKEKSAKQFNTTELFSCLKFDHIQNEFQCTICNKTTSGKSIKTGRKNLLRHIKLMHNK